MTSHYNPIFTTPSISYPILGVNSLTPFLGKTYVFRQKISIFIYVAYILKITIQKWHCINKVGTPSSKISHIIMRW